MNMRTQTVALSAMVIALLLNSHEYYLILFGIPLWLGWLPGTGFYLWKWPLGLGLAVAALIGSRKWPFKNPKLRPIVFLGAVIGLLLPLPWLVIIFLLRDLKF
jgi:hypothetical protein